MVSTGGSSDMVDDLRVKDHTAQTAQLLVMHR